MTKEEAIKILEEYRSMLEGFMDHDKPAFTMAIESLQTENEWIPCSERLPDEGEKVLASTKNTVFTQVFKGTQGTSDSWWWNNNTIKTIYAWMPLPKPYKGGDTE